MIHQTIKQLSLKQLHKKIAGRKVYIWGAGNQGRGIAQVLISHQVVLAGFVDSSIDLADKEVAGLPVLPPNVLNNYSPEQVFVIISVFFHAQTIRNDCQAIGLTEDTDFIHYWILKPRDYSIDISGYCNLHCIACPRGSGKHVSPGGMMSLDHFKKVLHKIKTEDPFVGNVQLYQWGEPSLNKNLPEMITYAKRLGINCAISSNLNTKADFQSIIKSKPEWLRISASGWKDAYEKTHTGGVWPVFLNNLKKIAMLRNKIHPQMKVELFYHLYRHSTGIGLTFFKNLCKDLQIEFHPVYAYLISLDDVLAHLEGIPLPKPTEKARQAMLLELEHGLAIAQQEKRLGCDAIRSIHINPDLSVSNCMMYYYPEGNRAVKNFLENSIDEIMEIRMNCTLCKRCIRYAMHRYCGAYSTFIPDIERLSKNE